MADVSKPSLPATRVKRTQALRGVSLLVSGGATSAAKLNKRVGMRCPDSMVRVEGGRLIHERELLRSVKAAAERSLRRRGMEGYA